MKTAIVYYSYGGKTKKYCDNMAKEIEADIPVLMINTEDWDKLLKMGENKDLYRVLLNAKLDRLLIAK